MARRYELSEEWEEENPALIESDERLPWLESDDDEEAEQGFATSRIIMLGVLSLVVVGGLVAAVWALIGATSDEPPADGSLIAAPDEPYKTRPENAGGKTFAGTGDTSFAVGEGETREGQLADRPTQPPVVARRDEIEGPSISTTLDDESEDAATSPPQPSGPAVQVGAFPKREDAEAAWARLISQTEALSGVRHRIVEANVDIGRVYRLQAVTGDRASATRLCNALKADGLPCFVK